MEKGKTGKYFKYAIGEIVLVVIGILIALSINNWNENRIQNNLEITYLKSLHKEFLDNLKDVHRVQKINANNLKNAVELSKHTGPNIPTKLTDKEFSIMLAGMIFSEVQYRPGTGILNEIISSGKLSIISNLKLKKELASLDGLLLMVRFQEKEEHHDIRENIFDMLESENVNFRRMTFEAVGGLYGLKNSKFLDSNLHLLQSKKFDNLLGGFILTAGYLQDNYYGKLEEKIIIIIKTIEKQLKSSND
jgi:hypothetical protein